MRSKNPALLTSSVLAGTAFLAIAWMIMPGAQNAAPPAPQNPETSPTVIQKQTNLVLVDAVVTDKKGNYIRDLDQKEFKVYEDGKEQPISSFARAGETNAPNGPH